jgi:uncharacterized protein DUF6491
MTGYYPAMAIAALLAAAPATAQENRSALSPGDKPCLRQGYIYDFQTVPGNRSLIVTDLARHRYRLNFMGQCYDLQYQFGLRFKTFGVGSLSCVSRGDSVLTRGPGPNQCIIKDIQYQTPDMDSADFEGAARQRHR